MPKTNKPKKQYYVVVKGEKPGLYRAWFGEGQAAEQVVGFPGALYKGFLTKEEGLAWLKGLDAEKLAGSGPDLIGLVESLLDSPDSVDAQEQISAGKVVIHTDGGAIDNPGPGGFGVVLRYGDVVKELSGGFRLTTNNRMELLACIRALQELKRPSAVVLFSDSKYIVEAVNKGWINKWKASRWMRGKSTPVKNKDLWKLLYDQIQRHKVEFRWVKGHAGNPDNERCDQLAVKAARTPNLPPDTEYEGHDLQNSLL